MNIDVPSQEAGKAFRRHPRWFVVVVILVLIGLFIFLKYHHERPTIQGNQVINSNGDNNTNTNNSNH